MRAGAVLFEDGGVLLVDEVVVEGRGEEAGRLADRGDGRGRAVLARVPPGDPFDLRVGGARDGGPHDPRHARRLLVEHVLADDAYLHLIGTSEA